MKLPYDFGGKRTSRCVALMSRDDRHFFLQKKADGRAAIAHRGPELLSSDTGNPKTR
jgi:hypothetical protein